MEEVEAYPAGEGRQNLTKGIGVEQGKGGV
jgi:hypothetical protein